MVEAVRGVRRVGQRRLVTRAAEGVVHQLYRDDTGRLAVGAQTPPDGITECQHRGVGVLGAGQVPGHRYAVAVAVVAGALLGHGVGLAAIGVVPQRITAAAEQLDRRIPLKPGQIPYGVDAAAVQALGRAGADAEQVAHRQRPHLSLDLVFI